MSNPMVHELVKDGYNEHSFTGLTEGAEHDIEIKVTEPADSSKVSLAFEAKPAELAKFLVANPKGGKFKLEKGTVMAINVFEGRGRPAKYTVAVAASATPIKVGSKSWVQTEKLAPGESQSFRVGPTKKKQEYVFSYRYNGTSKYFLINNKGLKREEVAFSFIATGGEEMVKVVNPKKDDRNRQFDLKVRPA